MLRAKVAKLEARLRELEVEHSGSSSNNTPAPMSPMSPMSPSPSATGSSPSEDQILLQQPGMLFSTIAVILLSHKPHVRNLTVLDFLSVCWLH